LPSALRPVELPSQLVLRIDVWLRARLWLQRLVTPWDTLDAGCYGPCQSSNSDEEEAPDRIRGFFVSNAAKPRNEL
jgi:hypothetical protein